MEKYEFLSRTGEGAYGSVWRARDKNTGLLVAVKKMKEVPATEEEGEVAMREVRVLQLAKHVNIVNLLEAYKSQSGRLYLVFEYVERTLMQELKGTRTGMPPAAVKSVTWQLLQALSYLHRRQIIHRDVKPSNILISEDGVVKICDFGFARACVNTAADPAYTTYVVTRWYRPPEVLVGDTYGPPVDVWALGCIFAEMLTGRPLFPGRNHHDQLWLILKCLGTMTERQLELLDSDPQFACFRLPTMSEVEPLEHRLSGIPGPAMQLLRACLHPDPRQRASADELLSMPYFQGVTDVLPVDGLLAYPDAEMRAKIEQAMSQSEAATCSSAQALSPVHVNGKRPLAPVNKQQHPAPGAGPTSPTRLAPQQDGPPLLAKAVTVPKLEPCVESQRPPLLRHITAPPGGLVAKLAPQPPPHSLPELAHQHQHSGGHHRRSRSSLDGGSLQGSPFVTPPAASASGNGQHLGALAPPRGRPWPASSDGTGENFVGPFVRQLSNVPGLVASEHVLLAGRSQRSTWNGTSGPRLNCSSNGMASGGGMASGSGMGNGSGGGHGGQPPSLNSSLNNTHNQANTSGHLASDTIPVQRKAHSLAGNEALPIASILSGPGSRGPSGLGMVQGRSLAPAAGPGTCGGAGTAGMQLPPPSLAFPATNTVSVSRMSPSHPGGLRTHSVPPPAVPMGLPPGRASTDGTLGVYGQPAHLAPLGSRPPVGPGAAPLHTSGPIAPAGMEDDASEGEGDQNDGRRASDTVLYAAAALKEAKSRLDKVTSSSGKQQDPADSGGGGSAQSLGALRGPPLGRGTGVPDAHAAESVAPSSLPPLQAPRRMSAPEASITSSFHSSACPPNGGGGGSSGGGGRQTATGILQAPGSGAACGSGHAQRHNPKQQAPQGQPFYAGQGQGTGSYSQLPNGIEGDSTDGATAHVSLPALDASKAGRGVSGMATGVGVVRRPSKGSIRLDSLLMTPPRREEPAALDAVPE